MLHQTRDSDGLGFDQGLQLILTGSEGLRERVVEAVVGRLITPLIIGTPTDDGMLTLSQHVISGRDQASIPFARVPMTVAGGDVLVENLVNGEERLFKIPDDGRLRVPIAADAADPVDKRGLSGMPEEGPGEEIWTVANNSGLGDKRRRTWHDKRSMHARLRRTTHAPPVRGIQ